MRFGIEIEDPAQPEILAMLEEGERYGASLYPAESNHFVPVDELRQENVRFVVARGEGREALGIGAVVMQGEWAEVKRMWVAPSARGRGVSKAILADLEALARTAGVGVLRLETGVENREALALYERTGFTRCGPFAGYAEDPLSVFMEKRLSG